MKHTLMSVGVCLVLGLMVGCDGGGLGKDFSVDFPGSPKTMEKEERGIKVKIWSYEKNSSEVLMVAVNDLPGVPTGAEADGVLDTAARSQYMGMGGSMRTSTKTKLAGKYPGIEAEGTGMGGAIQAKSRIYLNGSKMYQLLALGNQAMLDSPDTKKFFDSFRFNE